MTNEYVYGLVRGHPLFYCLACDQLAKDGCGEATEGVEEKVSPVCSAGRGKRLLPYLDESAEKYGSHDGPRDEARCVRVGMALEILKPQYCAETEIHEEMQYLVDIVDLAEWRLGRIEE